MHAAEVESKQVVAGVTGTRSEIWPLSVLAPGTPEPRWVVPVCWLFVGLGVMIRLVRYLSDYPIWHDEAFLAASLWDRDYAALLRPLEYGQVAPWLFLAIERAVVASLGYSEMTLRLFPTICSVTSLVLFGLVSGRLVRAPARVLAVAVLATSFYPIRHGAEIKPYASDLLAALLLLAPALQWVRSPDRIRSWFVLTVATPLLLALSYPAVFVAGGISMALAPSVLRMRCRRLRLAFAAYNLVLVASFAAIYLACTNSQAVEMGSFYRLGYWAESFPPLARPWALPVWLLDKHSGMMMAYPIGDKHGGSLGTLAFVLVGCLALYRRGRSTMLALLMAPFCMGLLAAGLGKYPYGGTARTMQYLAPSICLLAGLGLGALCARIPRPLLRRGIVGFALAAMAIFGTGLIARDAIAPYRTIADVQSREFARRLWQDGAKDAEMVCLKSDLGVSLDRRLWNVGMSAVYLFHQRVYSDRHRRRGQIELDPGRFGPARPLWLVVFSYVDLDAGTLDRCRRRLGEGFVLNRSDSYVVHTGTAGEDWLRDAYTVLEFVPRREGGVRSLARGRPGGRAPGRL
jgi:hypothetical protein